MIEYLNELRSIVGSNHFSDRWEDCDLATSDIFEWPGRQPAVAVVQPGTTEDVSSAIKLLSQARVPIIPRGAGLSYTGGLAADVKAVVFDFARLNKIAVYPDDLVAIVGAGASWEDVRSALKPLSLKCLQQSPISGAFSTVGGLASQGLPAGTAGIIGLTVVLSDGSIVRTGAGASGQKSGPDMTNLFLGDCGAFGVKTEVVLRLGKEQPVTFATFQFAHASELLECLSKCMREGLVARAFAVDQQRSEQARSIELGDAIATSTAVLKNSGSIGKALRNAAKLAGFTFPRKQSKPWSLHLTMESPTLAGANAQLEAVRDLCRASGEEVPDIVPRALHAKPYSVRGFVGPHGERWVPLHGSFAPSQAQRAMSSLEKHIESVALEISELEIAVSWILSSSGPYVLLEPMFYWRDQLDAIHMKYLSLRNRARFEEFQKNPRAREFVRQLRSELRDIMDAHGAVHFQHGRFYRFLDSLDANTGEIMREAKALLDPSGIMNPGVLGLTVPSAQVS